MKKISLFTMLLVLHVNAFAYDVIKPKAYTIDENNNVLLNPAWVEYKNTQGQGLVSYEVQTTKPEGDSVEINLQNNEAQYQKQYITYTFIDDDNENNIFTPDVDDIFRDLQDVPQPDSPNMLFFINMEKDTGQDGGVIRNEKSAIPITADFVGNHAIDKDEAGAIYNNKGVIPEITGDFIGNYILNNDGFANGGAIYNNIGTIQKITGDFISNYAVAEATGIAEWNLYTGGGAVYNQNGVISEITGDFISNHAIVTIAAGRPVVDSGGGAIYNSKDITNIVGDFVENHASGVGNVVVGGGAIYNSGNINNLNGIFINNYVSTSSTDTSVYGGAIYNSEGTININADNTVSFSGNYVTVDDGVNKVFNDIYNNDGTIQLSGVMNLDGGISGDKDSITTNKLNINDGATLGFNIKNFSDGSMGTSDDGTIITNQTVTFEDNSTVTFNPIILATNYVQGTTDKYKLFDNGVTATTDIDSVTFNITNALYDITFDHTTGVFNFGLSKSKKSVRKNIRDNGGNDSDSVLAEFVIDPTTVSSSNINFTQVQNNMSALYQNAQFEDVLTATKSINPDESPVVSDSAVSNIRQVFDLVSDRLEDNIDAYNYQQEGTWFNVFYGDSNLKSSGGFNNKSNGFVVGLDHSFTPDLTLGVAYAYSYSDINTRSRDIIAKNHTPAIYAKYRRDKWFINGKTTYSFGDYDEKKYVTGINNDVEYGVNTFGLETISGYNITNWFVPELGLKYFNVKAKDYTDALGNHFDRKDANVFTGLIGTKFSKSFQTSDAIKLIPELYLGATYDFARDDNEVDVTLANMYKYTYQGDQIDRLGYEIDAGLKINTNMFEFGARYKGAYRKDYYNHTGVLEIKYEF